MGGGPTRVVAGPGLMVLVLVSSSGQVSAELLSSVRTSDTMAEFRESDRCRGECRCPLVVAVEQPVNPTQCQPLPANILSIKFGLKNIREYAKSTSTTSAAFVHTLTISQSQSSLISNSEIQTLSASCCLVQCHHQKVQLCHWSLELFFCGG